jgi:hypothetical protein
MSGRQITTVASHTARSIRRRLAGAARERRGHGRLATARPAAAPARPAEADAPPATVDAPPADDARLDALRAELVRELDRMAADDSACSASFRRI